MSTWDPLAHLCFIKSEGPLANKKHELKEESTPNFEGEAEPFKHPLAHSIHDQVKGLEHLD